RMHGADAGLKEARAFYIAGVDATSSVLSAKTYGIPASGTMAHSYIQAFDTELEAFRRFVRSFPDAILLVDTYDTVQGVHNVIELAGSFPKDLLPAGKRCFVLGMLHSCNARVLDKLVRRIQKRRIRRRRHVCADAEAVDRCAPSQQALNHILIKAAAGHNLHFCQSRTIQ